MRPKLIKTFRVSLKDYLALRRTSPCVSSSSDCVQTAEGLAEKRGTMVENTLVFSCSYVHNKSEMFAVNDNYWQQIDSG